jgi:zinc transport system substrate-binding protein
MKSNIPILSYFPAVVCALAITASTTVAATPAQKLKVVVSIAPIHALVAGIMEGVGAPTLLISGGASPHSYSLKPSEARALNGARVVVRVSDQLESFLQRPVKNLAGKAEIVTLTEIKGMIVYPSREGGLWERPEQTGKDKHDNARSHQGQDPHIWLDPRNAKMMVGAIAMTLRKAYPEHGKAFTDNAKQLTLKLDKLDRELLDATGPLRGKPYILFHDATRYFDTRYELNAAGAITISPDRPPGARRLTEIRAHIKNNGIRCVFTEPQFQPKLVQTLISGTGAQIASLDPIGAGIAPGPDLYFKLMRNLAASMAACLKIPS